MQILGRRMFLWAACFSLAQLTRAPLRCQTQLKASSKSWKKHFFLEVTMWGSELSTDSLCPRIEDHQHCSPHVALETSLQPLGPWGAHLPTFPLSLLFRASVHSPQGQSDLISHPGTSYHISEFPYLLRRSYTSQGQYKENKIMSVALGLTLAPSAK